MNRNVRLILGTVLGCLFGLLSWLGIGDQIEDLTVDFRLRLQSEREISNAVQLVAINDADIDQLGQWPIPRGAHVNVIQILHALGVKQTAFDVVFAEPSRDRLLVQDRLQNEVVLQGQNE